MKQFTLHTPNGFRRPYYLSFSLEEIDENLVWPEFEIDGRSMGIWALHQKKSWQALRQGTIETRLNGEPFLLIFKVLDQKVHLLFLSI